MTMTRLVTIDLSGDLAHFKQFYTTTSPLTFPFPPPPTVVGMVGALLGLEKEKNVYQSILHDAGLRFALSIRSPIKKIRFSLNLLNTKDSFFTIKQRTQIKTEFLRWPQYRLYLTMEDEKLYGRLLDTIAAHRSVYTLSLGLANLLANYTFVGELEGTVMQGAGKRVEISSIVSRTALQQGSYPTFSDAEIFKVKMPMVMDYQRIVSRFEDVFYERRGRGMFCLTREYLGCDNGENICLL